MSLKKVNTRCKHHTYKGFLSSKNLVFLIFLSPLWGITRRGHNDLGHNDLGHNDLGHNDLGHNETGA